MDAPPDEPHSPDPASAGSRQAADTVNRPHIHTALWLAIGLFGIALLQSAATIAPTAPWWMAYGAIVPGLAGLVCLIYAVAIAIRRRPPRFSLRTMFVVVTLLCVWLGWQLKIVHERSAILAEIDRADPAVDEYETLESLEKELGRIQRLDYVRIPRIRQWLGDRSVLRIWLPHIADSRFVLRTEAAFPEAILFGDNDAFRDSLHAPESDREANRGTLFTTGLIEK